MNGEIHVIIIRVPLDEVEKAARQQVPEGYDLVDTEATEDGVFFSYQINQEEGEYEVVSVSDSPDSSED